MLNPAYPYVILNPASAGGKTASRAGMIIRHIGEETGGAYRLYTTRRPKDAVRFSANAVNEGFRKFLVIGGDGTINEVVNGLFQGNAGAVCECSVGIISSGSGEGLARSLGLHCSIVDQIRNALHGEQRRIDIARVTYVERDGRKNRRLFVNECQIGVGAEIVRHTTTRRKRMGGSLAYGLRAFTAALQYESQAMTVTIDGKPEVRARLIGISFGNGSITAGGMKLTPNAKLDDGELDCVIIDEASIHLRLRTFAHIYSGHHVNMPGVKYFSGAAISVESDVEVGIAADGEFLGFLPSLIEILPSSLNVLCKATTHEAHNEHRIEQFEAAGV